MARKGRKPPKKWSIHPTQHEAVLDLLSEHELTWRFHPQDAEDVYERKYDTMIMGRFTCRNKQCPKKSWTSRQIAITIRSYGDKRYNARVYHQDCRDCGWICKPILDKTYAERVAYRLMRWSGIDREPPPFSGESIWHEKSLCEGCKHGECKWLGRETVRIPKPAHT